MELVQCRFVTDDVAGLAGFYAWLTGGPAALNEYYVEIQAGPASVGFSRRRFTEADGQATAGPQACGVQAAGSGASAVQAAGPQACGVQAAGSGASGVQAAGSQASGRRDDIILDFAVDDVDAEYPRIAALGVDWVMPPTTQPWGNRSMIFRDPGGNLISVFCRPA